MNAAEIRPLEPQDAYANRVLMEHAFGKGRVVAPPKDDDPPPRQEGQWGVFEAGGILRASLTIRPFAAHWGPSVTYPMGGIAGVATFADARGRGYVDRLLCQSLQAMRDAGQVVSSLYPFSWAFYRRYGWDWVGEKRHVTLPLRELRSAPEGRAVIALEGEAATVREKLEPVYTAFARRYHGVFTTDTHQWDSSLSHNDNRTTHVYAYTAENGASDGYLLWRYERDGDKGTVREFIANSPTAYRGLLSLLHYLATQCETARVTVPADTPLWSHLMHWDLETKVSPVFMGRVVDLAPALERRNADHDTPNGAMTLKVHDEHAPWNAGTWRITVEGGRIGCIPAIGAGDAAAADVTADIQAVSQAFWGTPSLDALRAAGRLTVTGESGYALLSRLLPAAPVFTLDDF